MDNILRDLNLSHLIKKFKDQNVTIESIRNLNFDELKALGVDSYGDAGRIRGKCSAVLKPTTGILKSIINGASTSNLNKQNKSLKKCNINSIKLSCVIVESPEINTVNNSANVRLKLESSGLGQKQLELLADDSSEDVIEKIGELYPKLKSIGYEFLRVDRSSRFLQIIPPGADGFTAAHLKNAINAGRLFIRPIQETFDLDETDVDLSKIPLMECIKCKTQVHMHLLRKHNTECQGSLKRKNDDTSVENQSIRRCESMENSIESSNSSQSLDIIDDDIHIIDSNNEYNALDEFFAIPVVSEEPVVNSSSLSNDALNEYIKDFVKSKQLSTNKIIEVRRENILNDFSDAIFDDKDLWKQVPIIKFVLEDGIDAGGLTRSFLTNLIRSLNENDTILQGKMGSKIFNYEPYLLEIGQYKITAKIILFIILNLKSKFKLFSPKYFKFLIYGDVEFNINDQSMLDEESVHFINMINNDQECNWRRNPNIIEYLTKNCIRYNNIDKEQMVKAIINNNIKYKHLAAVDAVRCCWQELGILDEIKNNYSIFTELLCAEINISAESIINMFDMSNLAKVGQSNHQSEKQTIFFINKYIRKVGESVIEYNNKIISLLDIVEYFTGGTYVPLVGFEKKIQFSFYNASWNTNKELSVICNPLPKIHTCNFVFDCPRNCLNYAQFEKTISFIVMECKDFGDH